MRHSAWHPSRAKGNISSAGIVLGIIGLAINPLFGIIGTLIGEKIHNCTTQKSQQDILFWETPIK